MRRIGVALFVLAALVVVGTAGATFSGTNGRISYNHYDPVIDSSSIWSARKDGSDQRQLTNFGPGTFAQFSDWSPDGSKIAFDTDQSGIDVEVWVMNADGTGKVELAIGPGFNGDPAWSPDATKLAIESDRGDYPAQEGIWIVNAADGSGATRVTTLPKGMEFDSEPQFSPDGQWIAFSRYKSCKEKQHGRFAGFPHGCLSAIFTVRADGSGLSQLTPWGMNASAPDWSPNGSRITFDSGDAATVGDKPGIWVMNADGSSRQQIVSSPVVKVTGPQATMDFRIANNPVYSPDGMRILYTRWLDGDGNTSLISVKTDGSDPQVLVTGGFQNKADWGTNQG